MILFHDAGHDILTYMETSRCLDCADKRKRKRPIVNNVLKPGTDNIDADSLMEHNEELVSHTHTMFSKAPRLECTREAVVLLSE